mgnify:CR=1 FL=1
MSFPTGSTLIRGQGWYRSSATTLTLSTELTTIALPAAGIIDWGAGDVTLTGGTNTLTLAGGQLIVPQDVGSAPSFTFTGFTGWGVGHDGSNMHFSTAGARRWLMVPAGHFIPVSDNTTDVGDSASLLFPRILYAATSLGTTTNRVPLVAVGTSGIDSTGDVVIAMGTGAGTAKSPGVANVNTTAVGNVGVGTDDLMTYSHPANSLSANGKGVRITAWGTAANNANAKTVTLAYGATTLVSTVLTVSHVGTWRIVGEVIRTGAATQEAIAQLNQGGTTTLVDVEQTAPAETLSGAVTIKCTGTATADNDIVQECMVVEMFNSPWHTKIRFVVILAQRPPNDT